VLKLYGLEKVTSLSSLVYDETISQLKKKGQAIGHGDF